MSMSAFPGHRLALSRLIVSPAVENVRSDGVDDAWTHRYLAGKSDNNGKVSFTLHHQVTGLTDVRVDGSPLYRSISFWTFSVVLSGVSCLLSTAMSSSTNSSPRAEGLGFF